MSFEKRKIPTQEEFTQELNILSEELCAFLKTLPDKLPWFKEKPFDEAAMITTMALMWWASNLWKEARKGSAEFIELAASTLDDVIVVDDDMPSTEGSLPPNSSNIN